MILENLSFINSYKLVHSSKPTIKANDKTLFIIYLQNSKHIDVENHYICLQLSFEKTS